MAIRWAIANGDWNNTATWNSGGTLGIPTSADDVWANNFTVNMNTNATVISLNNTARSGNAIPQMTANNAPSPYVASAGSVFGAGTEPFRAFNRNNTDWWNSNNGVSASWLSIDLGAGNSMVIDSYVIVGSTSQPNNPRNWTFEGSNDNSNWTILHTVTGAAAIANGASYSSPSIGNSTSYRYYRVNVSLNGGAISLSIAELELYQTGVISIALGGSFNFNTAGVTVTCTSTSASLSQGAISLISVTATTGTVTLIINSAFQAQVVGAAGVQAGISHSGACNFVLTGPSFETNNTGNVRCIAKNSNGTITINGNLVGGTAGGTNAFTSTAGNTIVNGNIISTGAGNGVSQSLGNLNVTGSINGPSSGGGANSAVSLTGASSVLTVIGNVTGGQGASLHGINFTGASGTITGNILGGRNATAYGVNTTGTLVVNGNVTGDTGNGILTTTTLTVTGTVQGGPVAAIASTSANTINVTGDVYASATANGISSTNASGVVNLTGNMYNGLGRNAIYCQNVFISNTATSLWRVDTGGGDYKFLYSADTTPNLPATTNVRSGVTFGPALSLTGTMVVPAASDVRENVPVDNTVGTGELTSADIISGINASSDPLAVRLKNALTDVTAGNLISQYKDS